MARPIQNMPSRPSSSRTGFPEPFCHDRNTTLPHPDADTSPNASIEAPNFDLNHTNTHHSFLHGRRHSYTSFLHSRHHPHTKDLSSHVEQAGLYRDIVYADGSREGEKHAKEPEEDAEAGRGYDSADPSSVSGSSSGGSAANSVQDQEKQKAQKEEKRPGMLKKLFS